MLKIFQIDNKKMKIRCTVDSQKWTDNDLVIKILAHD